MVWGIGEMKFRSAFWPNGEFEGVDERNRQGWEERLKAYYLEQTPEERKRLYDYASDGVAGAAHFYPGYVSSKFYTEVGTCSGGGESNPPVNAIKHHEPPHFYQTFVGKAPLGSFMGGRICMVNEALKGIIERLEPGVHQFFPIEIRTPHNKIKIYPEPYYTIVIGQYLDSFSPEHSDDYFYHMSGSRYQHRYGYTLKETKEVMASLAFSAAAFGNAHLWRERGFHDLICMSDELEAEIVKAELRFPKCYRMKEF